MPPHLSPFVDNEKEGYVPARQKEIDQMKGIAQQDNEEVEEEVVVDEDKYDFEAEQKKKQKHQK